MRDRSPVALLVALVAVALGGLAAPAPAAAADEDVYAAWVSENAALNATSRALARSMKRAERSRFRRVGPVVRHLRRLELLTVAVRDRVLVQAASTRSGVIARTEALESLDGFAKSLRSLRLALRRAAKGRVRAARRLLRRSERQATGADLDARDAALMFERARGEASPPPPVVPPPSPPPPPPAPPPSEPPPEQPPPEQPPPEEPPPCEDRDPNLDGCQTQCESDQDPNVDGCQTQCEADRNPYEDGCQTEPPPPCAEDPSNPDCPPECELAPDLPECEEPPTPLLGLVVSRRASAPASGASARASAGRPG